MEVRAQQHGLSEERLFGPSKWQADSASLRGCLVSRVIPTGQERIEAGEIPRVGFLREKDNKKDINSFIKLIALTAKTQSCNGSGIQQALVSGWRIQVFSMLRAVTSP